MITDSRRGPICKRKECKICIIYSILKYIQNALKLIQEIPLENFKVILDQRVIPQHALACLSSTMWWMMNNLTNMLFVHMKITLVLKTFSSSQAKMNSDTCCTGLECPFTDCYLRFKHPKGRQHLIIEDHFEKQP